MGKNDLVIYENHNRTDSSLPVHYDKENSGKQSKPELRARVILQHKDDPALYEQILKIIILALAIADMDKEEAEMYQKTYFPNL